MKNLEIISLVEKEFASIKEFALQQRFLKKSENAMEVYKSFDMDLELYEEWFINSYFIEGEKTILNIYLEENNKTTITDSYYSIFEVTENLDKLVIKDLFTKEDLQVEYNGELSDNILTVRVYKTKEGNVILDGRASIDENLKDKVVKLVLEQFNNYSVEFGNVGIEKFIRLNDLFLMKVKDIIDEVESEYYDHGDLYSVFQTRYVKKSESNVIEKILMDSENVNLNPEFPNVYTIFRGEEILGEIEMEDEFLFIVTNSREMLVDCKTLIQDILKDMIQFISDEEVSLDDLI